MPWIGGDRYLNESEQQNNANIINAYYSGLGYHINTISAILGNMQSESTVNPNFTERGGGGGYGLVQWTPVEDLINACEALGISPYTEGNTQIQVIHGELTGQAGLNQWYTTSAFIQPYLNSGATLDMVGVTAEQFISNSMGWYPDKLAVLFMVAYERPSYDPDINHYQQRQTNANNWFNYLTGHPPTPTPGKSGKLPIWAYLRLL